jgi:hypothetical protein
MAMKAPTFSPRRPVDFHAACLPLPENGSDVFSLQIDAPHRVISVSAT